MTDSPIILPNHWNRKYNPNIAQDRTGINLQGTAKSAHATRRDPKYDPSVFMKEPAYNRCPNESCSQVDQWRILLESSPHGDGAVQFICNRCGTRSPVLQLGIPQMTNAIAKRLGLSVANATEMGLLKEMENDIFDLEVEP